MTDDHVVIYDNNVTMQPKCVCFNDHFVFQDTVLALQAMAELSVMTFSADSLSLDISLQAGGVNYKYDTITKATAGILQSKQVRICRLPFYLDVWYPLLFILQ